MSQHRGPLLLILIAVILVSGGYAAPIHKSAIDRDFGFHSAYAIYGSTSTDNWWRHRQLERLLVLGLGTALRGQRCRHLFGRR